MRILFLLAIAGVGCGTDDGNDTQSDAVVPLEGMYTVSSVLADNECGDWGPSFNDSIDGFSLQLTFPDDDTVRFHWSNVQDCPRDGADVSCSTDEPLVLDDYAPDNDARIMYEDSTALTWTAPTEATGQWTVALSCEGLQCEIVAEINGDTYPCSITMDWSLALGE